MPDTEYIRPSESLDRLVAAGILPFWIAKDAERHGMSEAENILWKYDWEWGWDLGDGYNAEQIRILDDVRKRIEQGIRNYFSNPELIAKDSAEYETKKMWEKKREEYKRRFGGNYVDYYSIGWVIDYEKATESLPLIHFLCYRTLLPTRTDIQQAQLMRLGVSVDDPMTAEAVSEFFPDIPLNKIEDLPYRKWALYKYYRQLVADVLSRMPDELPPESDPFWNEIIESQHLEVFDMTPARVRCLITFFRLNDLTMARKKKLSKGIY